MVKNIKIFYSYLNKKTKGLWWLFLILPLHFYLVTHVRNEGKELESKLNIHRTHYALTALVSKNLMNECNAFSSTFLDKQLAAQVKDSPHLNFYLTRQLKKSLGDLRFYHIFFKTYSESSKELFVESTGYLIENTESFRCFGLI
ncbi:MAG: hypothetical protein CME66_00825 [Halobacteriovoraceae bacterium]|nr:hypothetical protein [Halobacteriovoraceae bacterium]